LRKGLDVGYYVSLHSSDWEITESPELLAVLKEMPTKYHAIKRGGSSNGESWFSWVNDEDFVNAKTCEEIINAFGFETSEAQGVVSIDAYSSKTGQEDVLLAVLAPFVAEGAEMEWSGEEGERWLYLVKDGKLFVSGETRKWDKPEPYKYLHYDFYTDTDGKMVTDTKVIDLYEPMPEDLVSRWDKKKKVEA
jgi:hypothetical protein